MAWIHRRLELFTIDRVTHLSAALVVRNRRRVELPNGAINCISEVGSSGSNLARLSNLYLPSVGRFNNCDLLERFAVAVCVKLRRVTLRWFG